MRKGGHTVQDKSASDRQVAGRREERGGVPQEPVWDELREVHK